MYTKTLYKRATTGAVQQWTIYAEGDKYWTEAGQVGGAITKATPTVCHPKNVGKKNETSAENQALAEAVAKVDKKISKEYYFEKIEDIDRELFIEPMLAHKWADHGDKVTYPAYSDCKIDGGRLIYSQQGLKSRKGEPVASVPHIVEKYEALLDRYPDLVLDGEGYNHKLRHNLNEIMSLLRTQHERKLTPEFFAKTKDMVQHWVYDGWGFEGVTEKTPFPERKAALWELLKGYDRSIVVVKSRLVTCQEELDAHYEDLVANEFEGQMIRWGNFEYVRKRSKHLLKRKNFMDDEFVVAGFEEGKGNKKGIAATALCLTNQNSPIPNLQFGAGLNGTEEFAREVWENQDKWIGRKGHVRFLKYSPYGIPMIAKLLTFRDDV